MDVIEIKKLSSRGEEELNANLNDSLDVPQGSIETGKTFKREDVLKCFEKPFAISESIYLVGSICTHPEKEAHDVDIVIISNLPEDLQKATIFRMYRAFSEYFNISYDDTPKYLQIESKKEDSSVFTDYSSLYKFGLIPTPDEERTIRKMSLSDEIDDEKFEILSKSKRRIIAGKISTDSIDLEGEKITKEALSKIWTHMQKMPEEFLNCMLGHSSTQVGKFLKSFRNRKSALLENSIYVICELRNDLPIVDSLWKEIISGTKTFGFSIKINIPEPLKKNIKEICNGKTCFTEIRDAKFIEFSITDSPANPEACFEVISK